MCKYIDIFMNLFIIYMCVCVCVCVYVYMYVGECIYYVCWCVGGRLAGCEKETCGQRLNRTARAPPTYWCSLPSWPRTVPLQLVLVALPLARHANTLTQELKTSILHL
jgi:hypothetical protein